MSWALAGRYPRRSVRVEEHTITLAGEPVFYRTARGQGDGDENRTARGQGDGDENRTARGQGDGDENRTAIAQGDGRESAGGEVDGGETDGGGMEAGAGAVPSTPAVYIHGAPTSSDDWLPLLERTGGIAPDLFGFGRSAKGGHLQSTPEALADCVDDLLAALGIGQYKLVSHGWGTAAAVLLAARHPERVQRLILFNSVPLLEGQSWPWWARLYRMRGVGEVAMGSTTRGMLRRWLLRGSVRTDALPSLLERWRRRRKRQLSDTSPPDRVATIWEQLDQGTQRAVLRLVRSVDEERMQAMRVSLESLRMPTMLIWGERDPWWGKTVLDAYATTLPAARVQRISGAGHWPWLDDPTVIELVAGFLRNRSSD